MMRDKKIGILIPAFNGGALLGESVASAAKAGLPRDAYEIVITDNASDDDSVQRLPRVDRQGAPIVVHNNGRNLGRVENWNRAIEAAEEMGFGHVLFLMVGDLVRDASVLLLRERMRIAGAALGLGSYEIIDESGKPLRIARRINWNARGGVTSQQFLDQSLRAGALLFAPLNANLYDLRAARLRFDPSDPTHTDHAATIAFLRAAGRPIVYIDRPLTQWRQRGTRFHGTMDHRQRLANDWAMIERSCREAGIAPDRKKILCTFILRILFHARGNLARAWPDLQRYAPHPTQIAWFWMLRLVLRQIVFKTPWRIAR